MNNFVIGVGSQRAGSTLLHKILAECTPIFMHPVKELHYYDTLFNVRKASVLKEFSEKQVGHLSDRIIKSPSHEYIDKRFKCNLRANKILAKTSIEEVDYLDLYRPCVASSEFLGEITPEYMILPEEGVKKMRSDLGEDTKIILIGRNPVDRFISAFKLLKMYNNNEYDIKNFQKDLEDTMIYMPSWMEQQDALNDYEAALKKYKKFFRNVLFFTYEQLVEEPERIRVQLEIFLDLAIDFKCYHKIFEKKVNVIGETGSISRALHSQLAERYSASTSYLENFIKV